MLRRLALLLAPMLLTAVLLPAAPAQAALEDYASYQPQTKCSPGAKPGTVALGRWLVRTYGGSYGGVSRACGGGTSEHAEGRAFDWTLDARTKQGRRTARAFLRDVVAPDRKGREHAKARRMGIMYVIWDDRMYAAWDAFAPEPYLSSSCRKRARCSATLRHRDHVHISLTRRAGKGRTSWYAGRLADDRPGDQQG
ncbi:hypothetical protein QWY28_01595 [Nocardioides sp. SOB77]|uniref:ARB-07466-like C-terminal domain-containing protein n=1 Tax=Nocardioides oceani TaxID=3058369 RepID=A0ABT8FBU5_9ACTN|nr:hypothetical protein [Nocardioides oceani]MDN4171627.1 hypothetical protein [Nocardioides oceani]